MVSLVSLNIFWLGEAGEGVGSDENGKGLVYIFLVQVEVGWRRGF